MDGEWIVLLEATSEQSRLEVSDISRMVEALSDLAPAALYDPSRYALQLRITADSAVEALTLAVARWKSGLRTLDIPPWPLARAEVLTPDELGRQDDDDGERWRKSERDAGDELLRRAFYDSLTGLPTREVFRDRVRSRLPAGSCAIVLLDLDGFARLNRSVGFGAGDHVLAILGDRLRALVGTDCSARLGGDEFAVLVDYADDDDLASWIDRVVLAVRQPIEFEAQTLTVTASIGVAVPDDVEGADALIDAAGVAMCAAKVGGGDRVERFRRDVRVDVSRLQVDVDPSPDRLGYVLLLERAAVAANDESDLCDAAGLILRQVCTLTGWAVGRYFSTRADGTPAGECRWHRTSPDRYEDVGREPDGDGSPADDLVAKAITAREAASTLDLDDLGRPALAESARRAGLNAAFAVPVLVAGQVVGVLEFFGDRSAPPDESLLGVMAIVGNVLGRVAERARGREALARSEEVYRTLAEGVPVLIWRSGTDARCNFFNQRWLDFTGRTLEQEMGDGWAEGVHPEDFDRCLRIYLGAFERREPFEMQYRLRRADGEFRWILDRGAPIGSGESFQGYVGGCVDINDRVERDAALGAREGLFRALVKSSGTLILVISENGTVREQYNENGLLGYSAGEGIGRVGFDYIHPDDLPAAAEMFAAVLANPGAQPPFECRARAADGSWRWLRSIADNQIDEPAVGGIVVTIRDVTDEREVEKALRLATVRRRDIESVSTVASWSRDQTTGAESWSPALRRLTGHYELSPPRLSTLVHPADLPAWEAAVAAVAANGDPWSGEVRIGTSGGEILRLQAMVSAVADDDGRVLVLSAVVSPRRARVDTAGEYTVVRPPSRARRTLG